jgi:hypothetical protein
MYPAFSSLPWDPSVIFGKWSRKCQCSVKCNEALVSPIRTFIIVPHIDQNVCILLLISPSYSNDIRHTILSFQSVTFFWQDISLGMSWPSFPSNSLKLHSLLILWSAFMDICSLFSSLCAFSYKIRNVGIRESNSDRYRESRHGLKDRTSLLLTTGQMSEVGLALHITPKMGKQ